MSTAAGRGMVTEHIAPYLPGFDLDPKDVRFLGSPIDLIAFKGLNASVEDVEIVFIEVKTGKSTLSQHERIIKNAVDRKRVSWRMFNPDVEVTLSPEGGECGSLCRRVAPCRRRQHRQAAGAIAVLAFKPRFRKGPCLPVSAIRRD